MKYEDLTSKQKKAFDIMSGMTRDEIRLALKACEISENDRTKTVEECVDLAAVLLGFSFEKRNT